MLEAIADPRPCEKVYSPLRSVEFCAGSAMLSKHFALRGFDALGIDHNRNRHKSLAPVVKCNLSLATGQQIVRDMHRASPAFFNWWAPPCGTSSGARDIPLTQAQIKAGFHQPLPLRSLEHVRGLPTLQGMDLVRVQKANCIYDFCHWFCMQCLQSNCFFAVENPRGSWLWWFPTWISLCNDPRVFVVDFQRCAEGGDRPNWTRIVTNCPELQTLRLSTCPGVSADHLHKPWGTSMVQGKQHFATEEEAAYASQLCSTIVEAVCKAAVRLHHPEYAIDIQKDIKDAPAAKRARMAAGIQPRGNAVPALIPEFAKIVQLKVTQAQFNRLVVGQAPSNDVFAEPSKVLRLLRGGDEGKDLGVVLGVFHSPDEWLERALEVEHPFDTSSALPDILIKNIFSVLSKGAVCISKERLTAIESIAALAKANEQKDKEIIESMDPDLRKIMAGKKLATLAELLEDGYPDKKLCQDLREGFKITGVPSVSGVFPTRVVPATVTEKELKAASRWTRKAIISQVKSSGDPAIDKQVWDETVEESKRGWLKDEMTEAQLDKLYPSGWTVCRRFGLQQGSKLRNIDDLSEPGTNSAYHTMEKLQLLGLDSIAAGIRIIHDSIGNDRSVSIKLGSGEVLAGSLHDSWTVQAAKTWVGRSLDLKSAYRQLGTHIESRWCTVVAVFNPETRRCSLFPAIAILFGSISAVYGFNRTARALWWLGAKYLQLIWFSFYDDYPMLDNKATARIAHLAAQKLFAILGFEVAMEERKNKPFEFEFATLGAQFDLRKMSQGQAILKNTEKRINDNVAIIGGILKAGSFSRASCHSLKGKLQYAEAQCMGRIACSSARILGEVIAGTRPCNPIDRTTRDVLAWFSRRLQHSKPKQLLSKADKRSVILFTDAASEGQLHTCGGILHDEASGTKEFFSLEIEPRLIVEWRSTGIVQIITHAEVYPVWIARITWSHIFHGRRTLMFVDNEGARHSLIRGFMDSASGDPMIQSVMHAQCDQNSSDWVARVPSPSNPSDGVSRLDCTWALQRGYQQVFPVQPKTFLVVPGSILVQ